MPDAGRAQAVRAGPLAWSLAWLAHPVTVVALGVLALNDHVLKARYPGVVTGKLSDLAGLVLAPAVLGAVLGLVPAARRNAARPRWPVLVAVAVTGVGFVLVKAIPAAADSASALWSVVGGPARIRADVTDLVALPALGLALWVGLGAPAAGPPRSRRAGALVTLFLLPTATLAIAATSAPSYPDAISVQSWNGAIVAGQGDAYRRARTPETWRISHDGGLHWQRTDPETLGMARAQTESVPREGCAPEASAHCYRIVPGHLRVEETLDGGATWRVAWQVTDEQRRRLARRYPDLGNVADNLSSRALAVAATPGGHAVVVANGRDGFALRTADGTWRRIGFGADVGSSTPGSVQPLDDASIRDAAPEVTAGILAALFAVAIAGCVALWRDGSRWPTAVAAPLLAVGAALALAGGFGMRDTDDARSVLVVILGTALTLLTAYGVLLLAVLRDALRPVPAAVVGLLGVLMPAVGVLAFGAWASDAIGYRAAGLITLAGAVVGIALAVTLATARDGSDSLSTRGARSGIAKG